MVSVSALAANVCGTFLSPLRFRNWAEQTLQGICAMRTVSLKASSSIDWRAPSIAVAGCLLLGLALAVSTTPAAAQGTPAQRAACEQDAYRFCSQYIPDESRTANCLRRHRVSLSPACRAMFSGRRRR